LGGSLAAFETKANAICISASAASRALAKPASAAGVKKYLDDDFPIIAGATKKLQALVAPPAEAAAYQSYVSAINQQLAVLRQAKADADRGDANAAISLAKSTGRGVQAKAHQAALAAHLTECAK
jgi:hypothetical protein